jgi:hypothetical protein
VTTVLAGRSGVSDFYLPRKVQTGSGARPVSYSVGNVVSYPRVKRAGHEADHSPTSGVEVKNGVERGAFTFTCIICIRFVPHTEHSALQLAISNGFVPDLGGEMLSKGQNPTASRKSCLEISSK